MSLEHEERRGDGRSEREDRRLFVSQRSFKAVSTFCISSDCARTLLCYPSAPSPPPPHGSRSPNSNSEPTISLRRSQAEQQQTAYIIASSTLGGSASPVPSSSSRRAANQLLPSARTTFSDSARLSKCSSRGTRSGYQHPVIASSPGWGPAQLIKGMRHSPFVLSPPRLPLAEACLSALLLARFLTF